MYRREGNFPGLKKDGRGIVRSGKKTGRELSGWQKDGRGIVRVALMMRGEFSG